PRRVRSLPDRQAHRPARRPARDLAPHHEKDQGDHMIVSVFVRRLKPGATFGDFVREWEADEGFGVPTRVFTAQSLSDPREILSIGFVVVGAEEVTQWLATAPASETVRHERIDTV